MSKKIRVLQYIDMLLEHLGVKCWQNTCIIHSVIELLAKGLDSRISFVLYVNKDVHTN